MHCLGIEFFTFEVLGDWGCGK